jgi:hypothetical protein
VIGLWLFGMGLVKAPLIPSILLETKENLPSLSISKSYLL